MLRVIWNFSQESYYLENKVGVVNFTKRPYLLQNLLLPVYFLGNRLIHLLFTEFFLYYGAQKFLY